MNIKEIEPRLRGGMHDIIGENEKENLRSTLYEIVDCIVDDAFSVDYSAFKRRERKDCCEYWFKLNARFLFFNNEEG